MGRSCNRLVVLVAATVVTLASAVTVRAESSLPKFNPKAMVPLVHGPNWIDLDGDGRKDLVMKSRWEINGPHSASVYSVHRRLVPNDPFRYEGPDWHLVPFIDGRPGHPHGVESIVTHEGADCILRDIRLFAHGKGAKTETLVIIAERDAGEGFWEERPFRFRVFKWLRAKDVGEDEAQNFVGIAFRLVGEVTSKKAYCGANEAFKNEFGVENPEKSDERR
ncbi:hypothetical protein [Magnetospirillum sp. UT-4]|uniref:hypothetical protein n=1 Tax=Magnetospirillum sp. UT-4 TaxID=2681467 RepID=UPI0013831C11|nr:hypothetical protein [Magnetospirillum sp. UT-4]CAA7626540.1 exported hypothetical protein [Magnetospirillum sp. UT-4]